MFLFGGHLHLQAECIQPTCTMWKWWTLAELPEI